MLRSCSHQHVFGAAVTPAQTAFRMRQADQCFLTSCEIFFLFFGGDLLFDVPLGVGGESLLGPTGMWVSE